MTVRCGSCGRESEWPHPEVGCGSCGMVVRVPVHPVEQPPGHSGSTGPAGAAGARDGVRDGVRQDPAGTESGHDTGGKGGGPGEGCAGGGPGAAGAGPGTGPAAKHSAASRPPMSRPAFRPVTIRTARDAVVTAALYLRWLGFQDVRQPDAVPIPSAVVDLRAPGVVAQVDPTTAPAGLRAVECVWLNGLTASATSVYFSLAGYTEEARGRADDLGIPLFVMDLTGMPQPVNDPADRLVGMGA
ncbi:hypothetical protein [Streptomyces sp. NBC_00158]|uniref:hypothetical protein n=1 Tax=Streptomyces sp. NBC_00158 TaxID=2903627 RepID=UPI0038683307